MNIRDARKALLYLGVNTAIFLFSSVLVGYGAYVYTFYFGQRHIGFARPERFFLVSFVSEMLGIEYMRAMDLLWLLGVLGMIGGLIGIVNVIRRIVVQAICRRKHYATERSVLKDYGTL